MTEDTKEAQNQSSNPENNTNVNNETNASSENALDYECLNENNECLLPFERIKRTVLIRKEAITDPKFGCKPEDRTTEELIRTGIINVDKNKGPTSHQISSYIQKIFKLKKSGHSGTLDPKVTGVLPVALEKSTKIVLALLNAGKEYVCLMHIHKDVEPKKIKEIMFKKFIGKIKQLPPIKSAVKRQWRYRKIYYIDILEINGKDVLFTVGCQAGTYIRKLCSDIGKELGTGAHMAELRRSKAGPFNETNVTNLIDIHDANSFYKEDGNDKWLRQIILPLESGTDHLPKVWIFDTTVDTLCHGADLHVPGISKIESDIQEGEVVAVMTLKNELVLIGEARMISAQMKKKNKGLAVKTTRVFMERGTYPRMKKK
ncbi:RNA-guided pseudouridylation complex pseudouridine synthase subunit Cbf5 [Candidatus Woesearchaeota archaeon]|jgi:H/ACA ribonucleoprotein complex subunit 4|nr:RNA-guided pseudouridylation complex pseudouridine synthase subunit Cbf5 [Candidatus Woesearchaeota archaeon]MBT6518850.1 RNA-guided pseudouridylation complex pseudouridine synthase subunit Cbf5 [Candidatus Woesearchaeota archaeon]MBT7367989.1 RNA-guided pseudouridylation complex pseudouridine synthase subunit Cbf5 [Candidatus Woesearchaeota archaeon]